MPSTPKSEPSVYILFFASTFSLSFIRYDRESEIENSECECTKLFCPSPEIASERLFDNFVNFFLCSFHSQTDVSCRNTKQSVGGIITQTNFVVSPTTTAEQIVLVTQLGHADHKIIRFILQTLKYVTDGWGTDSNGFKLVITAVKNSSK